MRCAKVGMLRPFLAMHCLFVAMRCPFLVMHCRFLVMHCRFLAMHHAFAATQCEGEESRQCRHSAA
jgi:hypothetical protein